MKAARSASAVSSGTCLSRPARYSITRARSCGSKKLAQTSRVSRMAVATRRALAGLPPLSILEQMAARRDPAAAHARKPRLAHARALLRGKGRPEQYGRNRLARLAADHEVHCRGILVLILGQIALDRR